MRAPKVRQVDTKGTLARVERNVRIARSLGARVRRDGLDPGIITNPRSAEWLPLLSPDERQARGELSPGLWIVSVVGGASGLPGV